MLSLKEFAIAKREKADSASSYIFDTMANCTIEKVDSWEWDADEGTIEVVGVKFKDADGNSMQLNTKMENLTRARYEKIQKLEGVVCTINAKLFVNKDGVNEYQGRTTEWSFDSATPVAVVAGDGMIRGGVSPM